MGTKTTGGKKPKKKKNTPKEILLRCIRNYEFNWLQIPFAIFLAFFVWAVTYKPEESAPAPKRKGIESFIGYDPSREIYEISHIDYTNRTIEYRPLDTTEASTSERTRRNNASAKRTSSSGTTIYDNNGKPLHIDASPEDILEQLRDDIDFDDLADYYDYYPDDEW